MSNQVSIDKIRNDPKYAELVRKRSGFAWTLSAVLLVVYYGFILLIAFDPQFLGQPVTEGSVSTIGFPIGVGVILCAIGLTGIYVYRANTEFDNLIRQVIEGAK